MYSIFITSKHFFPRLISLGAFLFATLTLERLLLLLISGHFSRSLLSWCSAQCYPVVKRGRAYILFARYTSLWIWGRMGKFSFMSLLLGSLVNFHVDSQNIANFLGTFPVLGRFMQDLELDSVFMNLPFLHNDVTKIKFLLYTSKNPNEGDELRLEEPLSFINSHFNSNNPVKILIHGYAQSANSVDFPKSLKEGNNEILAYLEGEKLSGRGNNNGTFTRSYNIIALDWSVLSKEIIYFSSAVHTEKVGQRVGEFIVYLKNNKYIRNYSSVHIIGFSLGSHVAGIAGNFVQTATNGTEGIGRITGLDPAGPGFISVPLKIRLDPGDADFVDVIHSNMGSVLFAQYGTPQKLGHADFFPNGGSRQPACDVSLLTEYTIPRRLACNHLKAAEYYKRTIQGEVFRGCSCSTWRKFEEDSCDCSQSNSTAVMGEFCNPTWVFINDNTSKNSAEK